MARNAKSLGKVVNEAVKSIGEPEITAFSTDATSGDLNNILQQRLIEAINDDVTQILEMVDFEWGMHHVNFLTTADITTGSAAVTNGSSTVNSVDSSGTSATNWSSASADMWFRITADTVSYPVATVTTSGTPHTLTLGVAADSTSAREYVGSTASAGGYRLFQDTYALSTSDLSEIKHISYGEAAAWTDPLSHQTRSNQLQLVPFASLMSAAGGDLHRNTSGKPHLAAEIAVDSDDNPRLVLWPFPTDAYLVDVWYQVHVSENTTFGTNLFGGDAPSVAYSMISHRAKSIAHLFDEDQGAAAFWEQRYQEARSVLLMRENRPERDASLAVETYQRNYNQTFPARSGIAFDNKSAAR
jgi:hypothetical protein